jgi:hypothetical protein
MAGLYLFLSLLCLSLLTCQYFNTDDRHETGFRLERKTAEFEFNYLSFLLSLSDSEKLFSFETLKSYFPLRHFSIPIRHSKI